VGNRQNFGPGVDVRGEGGYIVAPPSRHPSGRGYLWEGATDPDDGAHLPSLLARLPETWLAALTSSEPHGVTTVGGRQAAPGSAGANVAKLAAVQRALSRIDPDCPRETWIHVAMGLRELGEAGLALFQAWSAGEFSGRRCAKYPGTGAILRQWRSLSAPTGGSGRGLGSVFWYARQAAEGDPAQGPRLRRRPNRPDPGDSPPPAGRGSRR
jgi:hypothetical protein